MNDHSTHEARLNIVPVNARMQVAEGVSSAHASSRYGIDIRGFSTHAEADDLTSILDVLNGRSGFVRIVDRQDRRRTLEGTVEDVRSALLMSTLLREQEHFSEDVQKERSAL